MVLNWLQKILPIQNIFMCTNPNSVFNIDLI